MGNNIKDQDKKRMKKNTIEEANHPRPIVFKMMIKELLNS